MTRAILEEAIHHVGFLTMFPKEHGVRLKLRYVVPMPYTTYINLEEYSACVSLLEPEEPRALTSDSALS
jgi:hypothetical protein